MMNKSNKKCAKFWVDWMKIVSLMLPAELKNMDSKKNRHSHHFEKKN